MKLEITCVTDDGWPVLSWVAQAVRDCPGSIRASCGSQVETGETFIVEGVWPGHFPDAGFDESPLFYGSGLRIRGDRVIAVTSCSMVDRLWSFTDDKGVAVSNSLPALLHVVEAELVPTEARYARWVQTAVKGRAYEKNFPVSRGRLRVHYFENIEFTDSDLSTVSKDEAVEAFADFSAYRHFLYSTAEALGTNAVDPNRAHPVEVLSTASSGYDSPVATLLAKRAGGRRAYTIASARSVLPRNDSGAAICRTLGMECEIYTRRTDKISGEIWFWAANGTWQDMNLGLFEYPTGPSLLMTGFNGDVLWERTAKTPSDELARKDSTGLGFCEYRLARGVIHCPVPYWGIAQAPRIRAISRSDEMRPWAVTTDYDRPIPRRILEDEGVERTAFGQRKGATSMDEFLTHWPYSNELSESYIRFLHENRLPLPPWTISQFRRQSLDFWRSAIRTRLFGTFAWTRLFNNWAPHYDWEYYLMPWAVNHIVQQLSRARSDLP